MSEQAAGPVTSALEEGGWRRVSDRILQGLCHDLAGRASSLGGLVQLIQLGDREPDSVAPFLDAEVTRLEEIIRLLRLLPGDPDAGGEPLAPSELIPTLVLLQRHHRGLESVEIVLDEDRSAPPILVNWTAFARAFLLVLSEAARRAEASGSRNVKAYYRTHGAGVAVGFEMVPGDRPEEDSIGASAAANAAWRALGKWGVDVLEAHGREAVKLELRFPDLATGRAREAAAG